MRITHLALFAVVSIAATGCSRDRAELERDYVDACIMRGEYNQSVCECVAALAGNELSPRSLELLVTTLEGDETQAAHLRDRAGLVEVMAAGTFAVDGPARCLRESDDR